MKEFIRVATLERALAQLGGFPRVGTERLPLGEALGRVLAEAPRAATDVPDFSRATMDGLAVRASSTFGASEASPALLTVVGTLAMGEAPRVTVGPGEAAWIATGGMMPPGADAVVMVEHAEAIGAAEVEVMRSAAPGDHLLAPGEDVHAGDVVVPAGTRLRPQELGLCAALGLGSLVVHVRPRVAVLSTGDEIVPIDETPPPGRVRDVNATTLCALCAQAGATARSLGIVSDDVAALDAACRRALDEADVVLVSGGSSVGARDYTLEVLAGLPEAEVLFHGVAIKPGKPTILAKVGGKAFWGLPGQVTSAMVVFDVLVRPQLELQSGLAPAAVGADRRRARARLGRNLASVHGRTDFARVRLRAEADGLWADPVVGPSGLLRTMVDADGLVAIPMDVEGLHQGDEVWVTLF